uniref:NADH dehydrogenase subunit 3 n=1 Tax=Pontoscolex corethrurus TaxID=195581 RepID=V9N209_9ANNE|nr:NADH dehydrogenase subunit 3 [Pontoscolex corethrurus]AGJ50262.1 NADH dehydrogenase subunit 3 [Pontoscolex corethrurus]AGJ50263.1 NADH dehydrogenase subunit 3 [Pontoscolex corethrurus]AGJ50264.1 NADH dehydrogenase subunit 3 [Pontoscolex corethrurus]AGJ50265.1 NADH dehydrogenase subunit 3 [Pontoscolex corethrurus]
MASNINGTSTIVVELHKVIEMGIGINSTISMSNTMKMIASSKNRMENGIRAMLLGSNPHSNGEDFSRSWVDRFRSNSEVMSSTLGMMMDSEDANSSSFTCWKYCYYLLIKS